MIFLFYGLLIAFTITDFIELIKTKNKNDIIIFSVLSISILILSILYYRNEYQDSFITNVFKLFKK